MPGPFRQKRQCSFSRPFEKTNKSIVLHILWIKHSTKNCAQVASGKNIQKAGLTWATCGIKQIDTQDFKNSTLCGCGGSVHAGILKLRLALCTCKQHGPLQDDTHNYVL